MTTWVQLSAGAGPAECQRAVARLADLLLGEADAHALAPRVLRTVPGDARGASRSVLVALTAAGPPGWLASWLGTIKWVALSPYRPGHNRRNWFIGVAMLSADEAAAALADPLAFAMPALNRDEPVRIYEGKHFFRRR